MADHNRKVTKTTRKKITVSAPQLPETYYRLLENYVKYVQNEPGNPYEFSIIKRGRDFFSIREQLDYATSENIKDFIKTPDALSQELPAAMKILMKLDNFDNQTVLALATLNALNLTRLRRRSIRSQIAPGVAFTGSIIGLLIDLQGMLAVSITDAFTWSGKFNVSLAIQWVIILIILLAMVIAWVNWLFTTPRIGLVDAFGDILQILISHRNLKE